MQILNNVLIVLRGSVAAQAVSFATLPILARLYSPAEFGRYQIFLAALIFLIPIASLRYELAILNAETDDRAFALGRLCLGLNALVAAVTLALCAAVHLLWPSGAAKLGSALWVLPVALLAGGAFQTFTYLLLRGHAFRVGAIAKGCQAASNSVAALALSGLKISGLGLVLGELTGRGIAALYVVGKMIGQDTRYRLWRRQKYSMRDMLTRYRDYPLISLPGSVLNAVGGTLAPLLIFAAFGASVSGQYGLVDRCISLPIAVVVQAVSQVYMASFSTAMRDGAADPLDLFRRVVFAHLKLGIVPIAVLLLFGPQLFTVVFGARWALAGNFSQIVAPLMLVAFVVNPVDMTLMLLNRQKMNSLWYLLRLVLTLAAWAAIFAYHFAPLPALELHVTVSIVAYLTLLVMSYRILSRARPTPVSRSG
ncbi:MAG TPA: lipopolysaccharide biosynthesis protein [Steroidobacteraceae bacterium]